MSKKNSFLKELAIYGLGDFAFKLIAFGIFPLYTYLLTPEQFGLMNLLTTLAMFAGIISNLGLNNAAMRYYYDEEYISNQTHVIRVGFWLLTFLCFASFFIFIGIAYGLQATLASEGLNLTLVFLAILANIPTLITQYLMDGLRMEFKAKIFTFLSFLRNILAILIPLVLLLWLGNALEYYFTGVLVAASIAFFITLVITKNFLVFSLDFKLISKLLNYGYPFVFASAAYWFLTSLDRWMIVYFTNPYELGLYSIGFKISQIVLFLSTAFGQAWSPYAIKTYAEDSNYGIIFGEIATYFWFVLSFVANILCAFSLEILMLLTPVEYWDGAEVTIWIISGVAVQTTIQFTAIGISLKKKTIYISIGMWLAAGLNFILNYWLIQVISGAVGAAIASLFSLLFLTLFYGYFAQKLAPINYEKRNIIMLSLIHVFFLGVGVYSITLDWTWIITVYKIILFFLVLSGIVYFKIVDLEKIITFVKHRLKKTSN